MDTLRHLNLLTKLRSLKLCLLLDLAFLKTCRNQHIIPKFIYQNFSSRSIGIHIKKRILPCQLSLLRAAIKDIRHRLAKNECALYRLHSDLMHWYHPIIWSILNCTSWDKAEKARSEKDIRLKKKLSSLQQKNSSFQTTNMKTPVLPLICNPIPNVSPTNADDLHIHPVATRIHAPHSLSDSPIDSLQNNIQTKVSNNVNKTPLKRVINLSKIPISPDIENALTLGLNFAHFVPNPILINDLVCHLDRGLSFYLDPQVALIAKHDINSCISNFSFRKIPLNNSPYHLIKNFIKEDIFIMRADKGGNTVILDKSTYDTYISDLLNDSSTYEKVTKNPIIKLVQELKSTVKSCTSLSKKEKDSLIPPAHNLAKFYGLPKVHKPMLTFRPIVSKTNSLSHPSAKFISKIISPLCEHNTYTVKNSSEFIEKLKFSSLDNNDILVSFDVCSLYTSVPNDEAVLALKKRLASHTNTLDNRSDDIIKLTSLCIQNTYFKFRDHIYKQHAGLAMGCPLSSTLADIFMDGIDIQINSFDEIPKLWIRYVDDIFAIWPHGKEKLYLFLDNINNLHPNIKFTVEIENNRALPFLDVLLTRNLDNTLSTTVYRKPTSCNLPIPASSAHPLSQKISTFHGFVHRAFNICSSPSLFNNEIDYLKDLAIQTGYQPHIIDNAVKKLRNKNEIKNTSTLSSQKTNHINYIMSPYIPGLSGKIGSILKKTGCTPIFKPILKTIDICNNFKDKTPNSDASGIYKIPCSNCDSVYIGQTKRNFHRRLNEHMLASGYQKKKNRYLPNKLRFETSAVAAHRAIHKHQLDWNNSRIIKRCPNHLLNIYEQLFIYKQNSLMNKHEDNRFPTVFRSIVI